MSDGKDLRLEKLTDRKQELRRTLPQISGRLQYADHVEQRGIALFERALQDGLGRDRCQAQLWNLCHRAAANDVVQD